MSPERAGYDGLTPPDAGLFGSEATLATAEVVIVGVPWEPTVTYGRGTSRTPAAIVRPSHQLDLYDARLGRSFGEEVVLAPVREDWLAANEAACAAAQCGDTSAVNAASEKLNAALRDEVVALLGGGRKVGVLGGDHSVPFGAIEAVASAHGPIGILHIDAHHDLRVAYEGHEHSHASIMHNLLAHIPELTALTSVAIRDYSNGERESAAKDDRVHTFYDRDLKADAYRGRLWDDACQEIAATLPDRVHVSFDVDGLDPRFCPNTGTPVPGGLDYAEALHLLEVVAARSTIVGFDLCEVTPGEGEWDLNVGARLLHRLSALLAG